MVAAWIVTGRREAVNMIAAPNGPAAILLNFFQLVSRADQNPESIKIRPVDGQEFWDERSWDIVEQEIRVAGSKGQLTGVVRYSESGARVNFSAEQWARVRLSSGSQDLALMVDDVRHQVEFERSRVQKLWRGLRGPRSAREKSVKMTEAEADYIKRKKAFHDHVHMTIQAGEVPRNPTDWLDKWASEYSLGPKTARRIRQAAIAKAKADGLPAALSWGRRGR